MSEKIVIAKKMKEIREQKSRLELEKQDAFLSGDSIRFQHAMVIELLIRRMDDDLLCLHFEYNAQ